MSIPTKEEARVAEMRADYVAQLESLDAERYEAQTRLAQVLGWGDFRGCSPAQQEQFAAWAQEVGLPHLGNPHIRKELFTTLGASDLREPYEYAVTNRYEEALRQIAALPEPLQTTNSALAQCASLKRLAQEALSRG